MADLIYRLREGLKQGAVHRGKPDPEFTKGHAIKKVLRHAIMAN